MEKPIKTLEKYILSLENVKSIKVTEKPVAFYFECEIKEDDGMSLYGLTDFRFGYRYCRLTKPIYKNKKVVGVRFEILKEYVSDAIDYFKHKK